MYKKHTKFQKRTFWSFLFFLLVLCGHYSRAWAASPKIGTTPRIEALFKSVKTVCFGRFLIDVPASSNVVWGPASVPLEYEIYPQGFDEVKKLERQFVDELKSEKAIYKNNIPLFISAQDVLEPKGRIVTGYSDFESIGELKIRGYFPWNNGGLIIETRPLMDDKDETVSKIIDAVRRLRPRAEHEIPSEPGNCIEDAFVSPERDSEEAGLWDHVRIGFRLKEFPDAHYSIYIAPANDHDPQSDSLETQMQRAKAAMTSPHEKKVLAQTKFFREAQRQVRDWKTGYEVLMREPAEKGSLSHHDFHLRFNGVPRDPFRPYADIKFETGVAKNAAGATKSSLSDEEALLVWDRITDSIRVRPTTSFQ